MVITSFTASTNTQNNFLVYATQFTFTDETTGNIVNRTWNFGDNTYVYSLKTTTHTYQYPGTYTVGLTSFGVDGSVYVASSSISVDYFYRDALVFLSRPDNFSVPGIVTPQTFKIAVTSAQIKPILNVDLYAVNSRSLPYTHVPEKWEFLTPTWRFTDVNKNVIEVLPVSTTNLFVNGAVVGVSGEAEFYYIDDTSTGDNTECPLVITATLETSGFNFPPESNTYSYPSYANNRGIGRSGKPVGIISKGVLWKVYNVQPTLMDVTENYISDVYPIKWSNVKIPILISVHGLRYNKILDINEKTGILFSYPKTNLDGFLNPITVTLSGIPQSYYTVDEEPLFFQAFDEKGDPAGGYIYTTVTPLSPLPTTQVQAIGTFIIDPNDDPDLYLWVSNPENNKIHRISISPYTRSTLEECDTVYDYLEDDALIDGEILTVDVPAISSTSNFNYYMSGFSGIYGIAAVPPVNEVYATDAELERLYKFNTAGQLLSTLELSTFGGYPITSGAYTPSNLSLDADLNIYVSLFNTISVLKFDKNFNHVQTFAPTGIPLQSTFESDFLVKPPTLETDRLNNLWVTYAHPLCSFLVYYNTSNGTSKTINLDNYSVPTSIAVDLNNNLWVANSKNVTTEYGTLQLYNSGGALLSSIESVYRPGYLAIDFKNNPWFTHGIRYFGYIDKNTGTVYNFATDTSGYLSAATVVPSLQEDEELGGLAIDYYNRVCVIDSQYNTLYVLPASSTSLNEFARVIKILPDSVVGFVKNLNNTFTYTVTSNNFKSAQANGDWSGTRWLLKYTSLLSATPVMGLSTPFTVYDFNAPDTIRKVNEDFNASEYLKSLALPEILNTNTNFFDGFLGPVAGTSMPSAYQDIGQTVYEKIANFLMNHSDVDTCGVEQLVSMARQVGLPAAYTDINYPAEILNLLDIVSIPRAKLWGVQSSLPLTGIDIFGKELDATTTFLTADTQVILLNKFLNTDYSVVKVPTQFPNITIYPLSTLDLPGFAKPIYNNYNFYEYTPTFANTFIENIIDWNNPYTTISPYTSTAEQWYGSQGAIEKTINHLLTKKLLSKY